MESKFLSLKRALEGQLVLEKVEPITLNPHSLFATDALANQNTFRGAIKATIAQLEPLAKDSDLIAYYQLLEQCLSYGVKVSVDAFDVHYIKLRKATKCQNISAHDHITKALLAGELNAQGACQRLVLAVPKQKGTVKAQYQDVINEYMKDTHKDWAELHQWAKDQKLLQELYFHACEVERGDIEFFKDLMQLSKSQIPNESEDITATKNQFIQSMLTLYKEELDKEGKGKTAQIASLVKNISDANQQASKDETQNINIAGLFKEINDVFDGATHGETWKKGLYTGLCVIGVLGLAVSFSVLAVPSGLPVALLVALMTCMSFGGLAIAASCGIVGGLKLADEFAKDRADPANEKATAVVQHFNSPAMK